MTVSEEQLPTSRYYEFLVRTEHNAIECAIAHLNDIFEERELRERRADLTVHPPPRVDVVLSVGRSAGSQLIEVNECRAVTEVA